MKRYCFALNLESNKNTTEANKVVDLEIINSIREDGIKRLDMYTANNIVFMIMEINESV